jgi:hypothetical protein
MTWKRISVIKFVYGNLEVEPRLRLFRFYTPAQSSFNHIAEDRTEIRSTTIHVLVQSCVAAVFLSTPRTPEHPPLEITGEQTRNEPDPKFVFVFVFILLLLLSRSLTKRSSSLTSGKDLLFFASLVLDSTKKRKGKKRVTTKVHPVRCTMGNQTQDKRAQPAAPKEEETRVN